MESLVDINALDYIPGSPQELTDAEEADLQMRRSAPALGMRLAVISPMGEIIHATPQSELILQVIDNMNIKMRFRPRARKRLRNAVEETMEDFFLEVARL